MDPTDLPTARIELEVDVGVEPISGRIGDHAGRWTSFGGWLDLVGAIERIREAHEKSTVGSTVRTRGQAERIVTDTRRAGAKGTKGQP